MRNPTEYEQFAAGCLRLSRVVEDPKSKAMLLQMAQAWVKLAERLKAKAKQE